MKYLLRIMFCVLAGTAAGQTKAASSKAAEKVVIHPTMSMKEDTDESAEVSAFMNRLIFTCPKGMVVADSKRLLHSNMSYKDTINALGQLECKQKPVPSK